MIEGLVFALVPLLIWIYLAAARGGYWLARERDDLDVPIDEPERWPTVVAVVPARDEADVIERSIGSLLQQNYPGQFRIVLVDDQSRDGTADAARAFGRTDRLEIVEGAQRPAGWTGKLWAVQQGIEQARADTAPDYYWLVDADISHVPDNLRRLVTRAEHGKLVLTSLMARLSCATFAEHLLVPAFVYFFAMLYPFAWVNDPRSRTAAAAGGCMLVRRDALERAGGIASIRHEIIDDCALARRMKEQGPIWLGLTNRSVSLRPYEHVTDIRKMVARSAFAQLGYSRLLLLGTVLGMIVVYAAAPFVALFAWNWAQLAGWVTWALMAVSFVPMLRFYRLSPLWGAALPFIGFLYAAFTLDSAIQYWRGKGGMWKGRAQAMGSA